MIAIDFLSQKDGKTKKIISTKRQKIPHTMFSFIVRISIKIE